MHRPDSVDRLRRIVHSATQVRALGCGHSFNAIADTPGDLLLLDGLPRGLSIDPTRSTVTVASGMRYTELAKELSLAGFALSNMASIPDISIAGACATATHGSGDAQPGVGRIRGRNEARHSGRGPWSSCGGKTQTHFAARWSRSVLLAS